MKFRLHFREYYHINIKFLSESVLVGSDWEDWPLLYFWRVKLSLSDWGVDSPFKCWEDFILSECTVVSPSNRGDVFPSARISETSIQLHSSTFSCNNTNNVAINSEECIEPPTNLLHRLILKIFEVSIRKKKNWKLILYFNEKEPFERKDHKRKWEIIVNLVIKIICSDRNFPIKTKKVGFSFFLINKKVEVFFLHPLIRDTGCKKL